MVEDGQKRSPVDWQAVRADYETGEAPLVEICTRYGVTASAIAWRKERQLWAPRSLRAQGDRRLIIRRMFRLLERQIRQLEKNLEEDMTSTGEKEVAVLGKLASTLEKLIQIDNAAAETPKAEKTKEMVDLRNRLAERIEQLKRA